MNRPFTICSWPRAIIHMDADAFFASCEQAIHPELRGKPVVTGMERGIVAAASYEAKASGVKRAMRLFEAKRVCPGLVTLPSDYETYSLFSVRLFDIIRRFSPDVEEYSIDEAFADLTGMRRVFHASYAKIAEMIQETVELELSITVSVGVSISKVLAKVASGYKKPSGLTVISGKYIQDYLKGLAVGEIWGIGANTSSLLKKMGIRTALEFARRDEGFLKRRLSRPYLEIWRELRGESIHPVTKDSERIYKSIRKTRTFTPPSKDSYFIFAQLSKNLENACIKARRHGLAAIKLGIFLKGQDFRYRGIEIRLSRPSAYPSEMFEVVRSGFAEIYDTGKPYRATGVILAGLRSSDTIQYGLFDDIVRAEKTSRIYDAVDTLSKRFGKHTIRHGSSVPAGRKRGHTGARGMTPDRMEKGIKGENRRQHIGLPIIGIKV